METEITVQGIRTRKNCATDSMCKYPSPNYLLNTYLSCGIARYKYEMLLLLLRLEISVGKFGLHRLLLLYGVEKVRDSFPHAETVRK